MECLNILAPQRYPWSFNGPRRSRHRISRRLFLPANYLSRRIEGITLFNPFPPQRFDLIHAFNRIPLEPLPFVIGFESHLPRAFGLEQTALFRWMRGHLSSGRCRGIVAISDFARRQFLRQHRGAADRLAAKLQVRLPNLPIEATDSFQAAPGGEIRVVFVGNHFARKGGLVALGMAELARRRGFPLRVEIISSLEVGAVSWTGPTDRAFYAEEFARLALPNVSNLGRLGNDEVLRRIGQAHFLLLPTFSDTFGYSAIEAMARATPVVATSQGALPEFIADGLNGILLPLETDEVGEWVHLGRTDRDSPAYAALFRAETDRLAACALDRVIAATGDAADYLALRRAAHHTARRLFAADEAAAFWDSLYPALL